MLTYVACTMCQALFLGHTLTHLSTPLRSEKSSYFLYTSANPWGNPGREGWDPGVSELMREQG